MGAGGALPYDALLARIGRASFRVINIEHQHNTAVMKHSCVLNHLVLLLSAS